MKKEIEKLLKRLINWILGRSNVEIKDNDMSDWYSKHNIYSD